MHSLKNMSTDIKLNKAPISKILQSGWFIGKIVSEFANLGKTLGKYVLTKVAVP